MRKIALYSLLACLGPGFVYGAECTKTITFSPSNNNWNAGANEYLFATKTEYNKAINTGYIYECDSDWCGDNTYVELPAGHVFKGSTVTSKAYYKCTTASVLDWDDYWTKVSSVSGLTKCTKRWSWTKDGLGRKTMDAEANEYLYATKDDYEATKGRLYGQVYECDSSSKTCNYGDTLTLPAGHVFQRETITKKKTYKCVSGDFWLDITDDIKDNNKPENTNSNTCTHNGKTYNVGDIVKQDYSCKSLIFGLKTGDKCRNVCTKDSKGKTSVMTVISKCPANTTGVHTTGLTPSNYYQSCKENKSGWKPCREKFRNPSEERCACWDAKDATTWTGDEQQGTCTCNDDRSGNKFDWDATQKKCVPHKVETCDGFYNDYVKHTCCKMQEQGTTELNRDTGVCTCTNKSKKWDADNAQCVDIDFGNNNTPVIVSNCEYVYKGNIECNGRQFLASKKHRATIQPENLQGMSCYDFNNTYGKDASYASQYFASWCNLYGANVPDQKQIDDARTLLQSKLNAMRENASVWKDADGNFNKARLASDMTAGVVLGTVGGVVSGVVIKKKQLEKGFDVLHCTVGGQVVADWGDEFKVVGPGSRK